MGKAVRIQRCGLSRQDVHEAAELHAAADRLGDAVQHLGRVAAGLALEPHDHRDLLCVLALHAPRHHHERVVERDSELLVLEDAPNSDFDGSSALSTMTASAPIIE